MILSWRISTTLRSRLQTPQALLQTALPAAYAIRSRRVGTSCCRRRAVGSFTRPSNAEEEGRGQGGRRRGEEEGLRARELPAYKQAVQLLKQGEWKQAAAMFEPARKKVPAEAKRDLAGGAYRRPAVSTASGVSRDIRYKRRRGISVATDRSCDGAREQF